MARKKAEPTREENERLWQVYRAADQIRAEGKETAGLKQVWARVKRNAGVAGTNQVIGAYLAEWTADRDYDAAIETAGMPKAVSTQMSKACVTLWKAAQSEAAAILERDRRRMEQAIAAERHLRSEALGMVDARDVLIETQRSEIARYADELERMREHLATVRSRAFWLRVVQEIWDILPEREALHVNDITLRIGADLVQESGEHRQPWNYDTIRGAIDERVYRNRLFVSEGGGRYRRRRPEDPVTGRGAVADDADASPEADPAAGP